MISILPAAGYAREEGIPKFLLPIVKLQISSEYHIENLLPFLQELIIPLEKISCQLLNL